MTTYRATHDKNYTCIANQALRDKRLSFRARGIHHLLLSYPDGWEINSNHLTAETDEEGRDAVRKGLQELEKYGYIQRKKVRDPKTGRMKTLSNIYEIPPKENQDGFSGVGKPGVGKPGVGKPGGTINTGSANIYQKVSINELSIPIDNVENKFRPIAREENERERREPGSVKELPVNPTSDRTNSPTGSNKAEEDRMPPAPVAISHHYEYDDRELVILPSKGKSKLPRAIALERMQFWVARNYLEHKFTFEMEQDPRKIRIWGEFDQEPNSFSEFVQKYPLRALSDMAITRGIMYEDEYNNKLIEFFEEAYEWCQERGKDAIKVLNIFGVLSIFEDADDLASD